MEKAGFSAKWFILGQVVKKKIYLYGLQICELRKG